jgi:ribonuclease HI
MITGAMKTTANDVLDTMANLHPFHSLVDKHRHRAAFRLATLPPNYPPHKSVTSSAKGLVKRHSTLIHSLLHTCNIKPNNIQTIDATRQNGKWTPTFNIQIADTRKNAIEEDARDGADVKVYTDGSGKEGKIGAGAVLYRQGRERAALRYRLGTKVQHTVYEGECVGTVMGVKLLSKERNVRTATICIDSQATIEATQLIEPASEHHIIDAFRGEIKALQKTQRGIRITIRWTPGHEGIEGNERADEEAKKAVTKGSSHVNVLPNLLKKKLPHSKAAENQADNEKLKKRAQKESTASPRSKGCSQHQQRNTSR